MKKAFMKLIDLICFVLGPALIISNIINFNHGYSGLTYSEEARINIGIGVALVAFGLLRKYWAKKDNDKKDH